MKITYEMNCVYSMNREEIYKKKNHCWYGAVVLLNICSLGTFLKTQWSSKNCSPELLKFFNYTTFQSVIQQLFLNGVSLIIGGEKLFPELGANLPSEPFCFNRQICFKASIQVEPV